MTARDWTGRLLGVNKSVTVPLTTVFFVTGNNLVFRLDCGRRVVPIDLEAGVEHPEDRTGFAHDPLLEYLLRVRPQLVVAALTLLRAHALAGYLLHGGARMGSYESWDDRIRSPLIWVGAPDPCAGRSRIREDSDTDLESLRLLLGALHDVFGEGAWTVSKGIERAGSSGDLYEAFAGVAPPERGKGLDPARVGYALRSFRGRIAAGLCLKKDSGGSSGRARWRVVAAPVSGTEPGEGGMGGMGGIGGMKSGAPTSLRGQHGTPAAGSSVQGGVGAIDPAFQAGSNCAETLGGAGGESPSLQVASGAPRGMPPIAPIPPGSRPAGDQPCPMCGAATPEEGVAYDGCANCRAALDAGAEKGASA